MVPIIKQIEQLVDQYYEEIVELRRYLHTYPEVSGQEFNTQKKIMAELAVLGLVPRQAANSGVIVEIEGAFSGKTIALRADTDAVILQDECEQTYRSQNQGVCHACGHDGHTAMLIGCAKVFCAIRKQLSGTIRLLFQPSEEAFPPGSLAMIADGALDGVDAIIGAHLWQPLSVGTLGITYDRMMASPDEFTITVQGRGGHGSMPQQAIDPILVGAHIIVALNSIVSRMIDPLEPAVVSLGVFKSGEVFNIIPDVATLKGTVRSFDESVRLKVFEKIETIVQGICQTFGASYQFQKAFGSPPVINHPAVVKAVAAAAIPVVGPKNILEIKPVMGGEDFSNYQKKVPGAFMFIGAGNEAKGISYPHHHPKFDIDEQALGYGTKIMVCTAIELLAGKGK